jgi:peroxiredoxin
MKKITFILFLFFWISSFGQTKSAITPESIQSNLTIWLDYQEKNIILSSDFIALDENAKEITKAAFLNQLTQGEYIPFQTKSENSINSYRLIKILPNTDSSIKASIAEKAIEELEHFNMEGTPFPEFNFKDLNGKPITNETFKNKIVVIKCWYIHCPLCIKEFPFVNKLTSQYKDRNDIIFISLAEDTPEQLKKFLAKKPLSYAVVPNMKKYMNEILHLNAFPTHFILNKKGQIAKVLLDYKGLELALKKESQK